MRAALETAASGLRHCDFETVRLDTWIGAVAGVDEVRLPVELARHDCRNHRLALLGLRADGFDEAVRAAIGKVGKRRLGVILGTSTAGILQTELAYRRRDPQTGALPADFIYPTTHNTYSVAGFVREHFGLEGPAVAVSTACSSSAKVFAAAARMIESGLIDAALVGGVDSLCLTTLYGFSSLELTSPQPCRPYDANRNGISVGEGAAFALLEKPPASLDAEAVLLLGAGESSDAYHMSAPHPEGRGAAQVMKSALADAGLEPEAVDYINAHGTSTGLGDAAEVQAIHRVFGAHAHKLAVSSTKSSTGHLLGAAGGLECGLLALAIRDQILPATLNLDEPGEGCDLDFVPHKARPARLEIGLTNSFGFGGTNGALLMRRPD